jgi:glycosyltransferase involved in cell wall biosynthesis
MLSVVIPVYKNEGSIERLLAELVRVAERVAEPVELVFVVDGSPDRSHEILKDRLPNVPMRSQLIALSRNFGSFSAIRAGLERGEGDYFAVLAADLQEPPDLVVRFLDVLRAADADIVFGSRSTRADPWFTRLTSHLFWSVYRTFVVREMPRGGVDVFACTRAVRDCIVGFREVNTNLIALLFWVGYRRAFVLYDRAPRAEGKSAWTFRKKLQYGVESIFSFTDLPIQLLSYVGVFGMVAAVILALLILTAKLMGMIQVPGYAPIVLTISFFGALTSLGLGIIGQYLWLTLQNARNRPSYIVETAERLGEKAVAAPTVPMLENG